MTSPTLSPALGAGPRICVTRTPRRLAETELVCELAGQDLHRDRNPRLARLEPGILQIRSADVDDRQQALAGALEPDQQRHLSLTIFVARCRAPSSSSTTASGVPSTARSHRLRATTASLRRPAPRRRPRTRTPSRDFRFSSLADHVVRLDAVMPASVTSATGASTLSRSIWRNAHRLLDTSAPDRADRLPDRQPHDRLVEERDLFGEPDRHRLRAEAQIKSPDCKPRLLRRRSFDRSADEGALSVRRRLQQRLDLEADPAPLAPVRRG